MYVYRILIFTNEVSFLFEPLKDSMENYYGKIKTKAVFSDENIHKTTIY